MDDEFEVSGWEKSAWFIFQSVALADNDLKVSVKVDLRLPW